MSNLIALIVQVRVICLLVNFEFENMRKEAIVVRFEVQPQYLFERTEKSHEELQTEKRVVCFLSDRYPVLCKIDYRIKFSYRDLYIAQNHHIYAFHYRKVSSKVIGFK
jgi:hypothetical protein